MRDLFLTGMQATYSVGQMQLEANPRTMDTLEEPGAGEGLQAHVDETQQHTRKLVAPRPWYDGDTAMFSRSIASPTGLITSTPATTSPSVST